MVSLLNNKLSGVTGKCNVRLSRVLFSIYDIAVAKLCYLDSLRQHNLDSRFGG